MLHYADSVCESTTQVSCQPAGFLPGLLCDVPPSLFPSWLSRRGIACSFQCRSTSWTIRLSKSDTSVGVVMSSPNRLGCQPVCQCAGATNRLPRVNWSRCSEVSVVLTALTCGPPCLPVMPPRTSCSAFRPVQTTKFPYYLIRRAEFPCRTLPSSVGASLIGLSTCPSGSSPWLRGRARPHQAHALRRRRADGERGLALEKTVRLARDK